MQCPNCGQSYQQGDLFCGECGTKLDQITPSTTTPESLNLDSHINKSVNHSTSSSVTSPNAISKEQPTVNQYNNIESSQTQDALIIHLINNVMVILVLQVKKLNLLSKKVKNSLNKCLNGMIQSLRVIIHLVTHY